MRSLVEMLSGLPTVSLVIHRSQLLWRVSCLDSCHPTTTTVPPYIRIPDPRTLDLDMHSHKNRPTK